MTALYQGGCHCNAVRFECAAQPLFVSNCHCASCRKTTGGAFSTWVGFKTEATIWSNQAPSIYASSTGVERCFCKACGTPLSYSSDQWPGERHFLIGTFDDPKAFTPRNNVFMQDALPWAARENKGST